MGLGLYDSLFALCHDEEFARVCGLPTDALNVPVAVMAALTVPVSMRVVGALLASAVMIMSMIVAQLALYSFTRTMYLATGPGVMACVSGLTITYLVATPPSAMTVVLLVGGYVVITLLFGLLQLVNRPRRYHIILGDRS